VKATATRNETSQIEGEEQERGLQRGFLGLFFLNNQSYGKKMRLFSVVFISLAAATIRGGVTSSRPSSSAFGEPYPSILEALGASDRGEVARLLPDATSSARKFVFEHAVVNNWLDIVESLVYEMDGGMQSRALALAATYEHVDIARLILDSCYVDNTFLGLTTHTAFSNKKFDIVDVLLPRLAYDRAVWMDLLAIATRRHASRHVRVLLDMAPVISRQDLLETRQVAIAYAFWDIVAMLDNRLTATRSPEFNIDTLSIDDAKAQPFLDTDCPICAIAINQRPPKCKTHGGIALHCDDRQAFHAACLRRWFRQERQLASFTDTFSCPCCRGPFFKQK
jgi:hypothetical protein